MSLMKHHALEYAARDWRVIPIFGVRGAWCECGNPHCPAPGKHPRIQTGRGLSEASADPRVVGEWWDRWPDANIAVACGEESGIVVVDLDINDEEDGWTELFAWAESNGVEIPETRVQETGSGGRHLLYRWPEGGGIRNAAGWLPSVDIKAEGGYILVAPSRHVSGASYRWLTEADIAPLPPTLAGHLRSARSTARARGAVGAGEQPSYDYRAACLAGPRMGTRDHFFNARAFELRRQDVPYDAAKEQLRRNWESTEQVTGNEFPWDAVVDKLDRVYREVEPDPLPDWQVALYGSHQEDESLPPAGSTGLDTGGPPDPHDTDVGNAWRLVQRHGADLRYTAATGWLVWDGVRWEYDDRERVFDLARQTARGIWAEAALAVEDTARERVSAWAKASESKNRLEAMVRIARTDPGVAASVHDFDPDPWLLCCPNGVVDLRTGELRPHRREDLITAMTRVEYDPTAVDDRWEAFLRTTTEDDQDLMAYLQRAAGYTLTADTREEVLFLIYGPKNSGKSTFVDALLTAVGDYGMTTQADTFLQRRGQGAPRDELASMLHKRMVATIEIPEGERFAEALVKQLTGGDRISARHLYKARFEFTPTFKLWFATNHAPRAQDDAIWRRIKRVPFPRSLTFGERDLALKPYLRDPTSEGARAVLAWAVRGCLAWQQVGVGQSERVELETLEYQFEQDRFGRFLEDTCWSKEESAVTVKDLYSRYQAWCFNEGEKPMTSTSFRVKLKERGFTLVKGTGEAAVRGLVMKEETTWQGASV